MSEMVDGGVGHEKPSAHDGVSEMAMHGANKESLKEMGRAGMY